jgi:hypothetical protein
MWRKSAGQTGVTPYSGADGNGDGQVGPADYDVWRGHFGQSTSGSGAGKAFAASQQSGIETGAELEASVSTANNVDVIESGSSRGFALRDGLDSLELFGHAETLLSDHVRGRWGSIAFENGRASMVDAAVLERPLLSGGRKPRFVSQLSFEDESSEISACCDGSELIAVDEVFATVATRHLKNF